MKIKSLTILLLGSVLVSCSAEHSSHVESGTNNKTQEGDDGVERIAVGDASSDQCANGGKIYIVYLDKNGNDAEDANETPLSTQIVCNGQNGTDGFSTLFGMTRVTVDAGLCAAGSGVQINGGVDLNRNGSLGADEIDQTEILCDGQNGQMGAAGPAGANGHSVQFSVLTAAPEVCAAGGSTLLMAVDVHDNGFYSATDPGQQQMTICNGQNGANASTPAYSPVDVIFPCGNSITYKEVLLRLQNGQVLTSFSDKANGMNTRLSLLADGTYMDTDGTNCVFDLSTSADGQTRSVSWSGQIQKSWPVGQ